MNVCPSFSVKRMRRHCNYLFGFLDKFNSLLASFGSRYKTNIEGYRHDISSHSERELVSQKHLKAR